MPKITYKLALLTMFGALLAAGSNASDASNAYNTSGTADSRAGYWACPAEITDVGGKPKPDYSTCPAGIMAVTAKADDLVPLTDAPVSDKPDQPTWLLEEAARERRSTMLGAKLH